MFKDGLFYLFNQNNNKRYELSHSQAMKYRNYRKQLHDVVLSLPRFFPVDRGGVRPGDGEADHGHAVHRVQRLLQEDPHRVDPHGIHHPPGSAVLRIPGEKNHDQRVLLFSIGTTIGYCYPRALSCSPAV